MKSHRLLGMMMEQGGTGTTVIKEEVELRSSSSPCSPGGRGASGQGIVIGTGSSSTTPPGKENTANKSSTSSSSSRNNNSNGTISPLQLTNNNNNNINGQPRSPSTSSSAEIILTRSRSKGGGGTTGGMHPHPPTAGSTRHRSESPPPKSPTSPTNLSMPRTSIANGTRTPGGLGSPSPPQNPGSNHNLAVSLGSSSSSSSSSSGGRNSSNKTPPIGGVGGGANSNSRLLLKIKRFLGTLVQFGCDVSPDVGERVRALVFSLVSGHLSIEEFHGSVQEVTSFPLRPFVLPFLRAHLPLLQREVATAARLAKQSTLAYVQSHYETAVIDMSSPSGNEGDIFHSSSGGEREPSDLSSGPVGQKRKAGQEGIYENGEEERVYTSTPKRPNHAHHPHYSLFSPAAFFSPAEYYAAVAGYGGSAATGTTPLPVPLPLTPSSGGSHHSHNQHNTPSSSGSSTGSHGNNNLHHGQEGGGAGGGIPLVNGGIPGSKGGGGNQSSSSSTSGAGEEEWKNIHTMLNCILQMVDKTKRALSILQTRTQQEQQHLDSSSWLRRPAAFMLMDPNNSNSPTSSTMEEMFKRQLGEMMVQAFRATEERVQEVKRRAEEAVHEVKRQALQELKRAVAVAEARTSSSTSDVRPLVDSHSHSSRSSTPHHSVMGLSAHHSQHSHPTLHPPPGVDAEGCWNCGRKAHETCSGCNTARYCSSFCQHKDWESHHIVCHANNKANSTSSPQGVGGGGNGTPRSGSEDGSPRQAVVN